MSAATKPRCQACTRTARWRVELHDEGDRFRIATVCGVHSALFRAVRVCDAWHVDSIARLEYRGFTA